IKYYYNPITSRLEPVAYESFTNLQSRDLSSQYKYVELDSGSNYQDWHSLIFSNKIFFAEYVKQLERISKLDYLDSFFNESNLELNKNLAIIYKEFPYKKFDKRDFYGRQNMIRKVLDAPKALHAYFCKIENNIAHIQVGAIDALPLEIKSISIHGISSVPGKSIVLAAKQTDSFVDYIDCTFIMPTTFVWQKTDSDSIQIQYSVLGASKIKNVNVFSFPHTDSEFIKQDLLNRTGNIEEFSFLEVNKLSRSISIKRGSYSLTKDLIIPADYKLFVSGGVSIDIKNSSKIISYSSVLFSGSEEDQIAIESTDSTSQGIEIINAGKSIFRNVVFKNLPKIKDEQWARSGAITFYESSVEFYNCSFYNCKAEDAINLIRSAFIFKECLFHNMHDDAVDIDFSEGTISNCAFEQCNENALDITMGNLVLNSVFIDGVGNKALNIKSGSEIKGDYIKIKNAHIAIAAEDHSKVIFKNTSITDCKFGVVAYKNKPGSGHPTVTISDLLFLQVKEKYLKGKKSTIVANGISIESSVEDVEILSKSDKKKNK
nr:right-handed parallel beta-helix repeat-containing protein [Nitrosopumilus sp.]